MSPFNLPDIEMPFGTGANLIPNSKRPKLWELGDRHHCPIIGTCLPMDELRKLARRFHFGAALRDDYGLHVEAVNHAHGKNEVSIAIQRLLDRKYALDIEEANRLKDTHAVLTFWKNRMRTGKVAGTLWAVYTHKLCTGDIRQVLFADIHMISHQIGAGLVADTRRLQQLEQENAAFREEIQQLQAELQHQMAKIQQNNESTLLLDSQLRLRSIELETAQKRLAAFESGEIMVQLGKKIHDLTEANTGLRSSAQRTHQLENQLQDSQRQLTSLAETHQALQADQKTLEALLDNLSLAGQCSTRTGDSCLGCPEALSARCILYVGGRASMISQYKQLAEKLGIHLIHHDGGIEESINRLPEMILGADAVLCPTDQISHTAYYQIKNQCKKVGKPCLFYRGTGIARFACAVNQVQQGVFTLNPVVSAALTG